MRNNSEHRGRSALATVFFDPAPRGGIRPGWWSLLSVLVVGGLIWATVFFFTGSQHRYVVVRLQSDRSGLVMERGAKVKLRGVEVGQVGAIDVDAAGHASLQLKLSGDAVRRIPANIRAEIKPTTVFGAKYVDLVDPEIASTARISAGAVLRAENVTTEVDTVFEDLNTVLTTVDPAELNAILSAFATGLRGRGDQLGTALSDSNAFLASVNPELPILRHDLQSLRGASDAYSDAMPDILHLLAHGSTTADTITTKRSSVDKVLLSTIGFATTGTELLGPTKDSLIEAVNILQPTTALLHKYDPTYTCLLEGAKWFLDHGGYAATGGHNGYSVELDTGLLAGSNPYRYPENLPKVNAKGGPGGKPSCGSLPDPSKNYPVKQLITDTGWGANPGDLATHPGLGTPSVVDYLFGLARGGQR